MWSPNELLKIEKQRDILSYITLQFFHFKKVPLEHCPFGQRNFYFTGYFLKLSFRDTLRLNTRWSAVQSRLSMQK